MLIETMLSGDAEAIVRAVISAAKSGDMVAARIVMDRLAPIPRGRAISWAGAPDVDLGTVEGRAQMLVAIVTATLGGELTPEEGTALSGSIELIRRLQEHDQLAADVAAIKVRLGIDG